MRLRRERRRRLVGRSGEVELFRAALAAPGEAFAVLFVHGPGGVGKTALLDLLADAAEADGASVLRVDARTVVPTPDGVLAALQDVAGGDDAIEAMSRRANVVLLLDTFELLAALQDWIRGTLLPALPADALVVIAGRHPPSPRWSADPAWRDLLRVVSLRNLAPGDTRTFLVREGVATEAHERLLALSHGHPLTLALLVDALRRRGGATAVPASWDQAPDLVGVLLSQLVDSAPGPRHRWALQVCAHTLFTTEELLRATLPEAGGTGDHGVGWTAGDDLGASGTDAAALFGWLRGLSFVDEGPEGVFPHDLVRDVLDADLRWRDPDRFAALHRSVRSYLIARTRSSAGRVRRQRWAAETMFVARSHPPMRAYFAQPGGGQDYIDHAGRHDRPGILGMTERHQGVEQAELAGYWLDRQPDAFRVFRGPGGEPRGYAARLRLHEASDTDLATDPGVRALWSFAQLHSPPRPGEQVMAWRFFLDREYHHQPSPSLGLIAVWNLEEIFTRERCAWDFVATYSDAGAWQPVMDYIDFARVPEADYRVGGRSYVVFAHDWRRVGVQEWLDRTADRELGVATNPSVLDVRPVVVLSQPEFRDAVRDGLRDLHIPARLTRSPLLRSRLARRGHRVADPSDTALVVTGLIAEAADALRDHPQGDVLFEVVDRTFLRPRGTQERIAAGLHLSFSTYRRYRDRAVGHIADWLWERELYDAPIPDHGPDADPAGD